MSKNYTILSEADFLHFDNLLSLLDPEQKYAIILEAIEANNNRLVGKIFSSLEGLPQEVYLEMIGQALKNGNDDILHIIMTNKNQHSYFPSSQLFSLIDLALSYDNVEMARQIVDFYSFGGIINRYYLEPYRLNKDIQDFEENLTLNLQKLISSNPSNLRTEKIKFLVRLFEKSMQYWNEWYRFFKREQYKTDLYKYSHDEQIVLIRVLIKILQNRIAVDYFLQEQDVVNWFRNKSNFEYIVQEMPTLIGPLLNNPAIAETVEGHYFADYAKFLINTGCKMPIDSEIIDGIYKNFKKFHSAETKPGLFKFDPEIEVIDFFNTHYRYFMKKKIEQYKNNDAIMEFIETANIGRSQSEPNFQDANILDLLLLARTMRIECENLDTKSEAFKNLEESSYDILTLDQIIDKHLQACLKNAYEMSRGERKTFIEKIWGKKIKNENVQNYLEDEQFMCSLIKISLFCRDVRNTFTTSDMDKILKIILKDKNMLDIYNNVSKNSSHGLLDSEKNNICQTLQKVMFENLKRSAEKSKRESSAKRRRFKYVLKDKTPLGGPKKISSIFE